MKVTLPRKAITTYCAVIHLQELHTTQQGQHCHPGTAKKSVTDRRLPGTDSDFSLKVIHNRNYVYNFLSFVSAQQYSLNTHIQQTHAHNKHTHHTQTRTQYTNTQTHTTHEHTHKHTQHTQQAVSSVLRKFIYTVSHRPMGACSSCTACSAAANSSESIWTATYGVRKTNLLI